MLANESRSEKREPEAQPAPSSKRAPLLHAALLLALLALASRLQALREAGPLALIAGTTAYLVLVLAVSPLRRSVTWLRAGEIGKTTALWTGAIVVVTTLVLAAWVELARPDLADAKALVPRLAPVPLALLLLAAALLNAGSEEIVFRGVLQSLLETELGRGAGVLLQGMVFGVLHYAHGFPRGSLGAALASIYGVALGLLRARTGGLLAGWIAHVGADVTIVALLVLVVP